MKYAKFLKVSMQIENDFIVKVIEVFVKKQSKKSKGIYRKLCSIEMGIDGDDFL